MDIVNPDEDSRYRAANRRFVTRPATPAFASEGFSVLVINTSYLLLANVNVH
ncbi:MAG: hypothetical protein JXR70_08820 [Spirochaetales bacterium]|nr:hypothetical protein [Spirochaetales bacterium]